MPPPLRHRRQAPWRCDGRIRCWNSRNASKKSDSGLRRFFHVIRQHQTGAKPSFRTIGQPQFPAMFGHDSPHQSQSQPSAASVRSEEHTSELQSLMRISYAVFCLKKKKKKHKKNQRYYNTKTHRRVRTMHTETQTKQQV